MLAGWDVRVIQQQGDNKGLQRTNKTILAQIADIGYLFNRCRRWKIGNSIDLAHHPLGGVLVIDLQWYSLTSYLKVRQVAFEFSWCSGFDLHKRLMRKGASEPINYEVLHWVGGVQWRVDDCKYMGQSIERCLEHQVPVGAALFKIHTCSWYSYSIHIFYYHLYYSFNNIL